MTGKTSEVGSVIISLIILEGLRMSHRATLILEQPEIAVTSKSLNGIWWITLSRLHFRGKNVIVETHSDHVVNRLVRRIVEDSDRDLRDLVAMYFVKNVERGSIYEPIEIDPRRGIVNWPVNFFDQNAMSRNKSLKPAFVSGEAS